MEEMDQLRHADFEIGAPDSLDAGDDDDQKFAAPFNTNDPIADQIMHFYRKT